MRRSSGPTPAIGLMAPPSTWYLPRNSRVRSMATTSLDSSTTQIDVGERRGSRQMRHCGSCATFPQISQNRTRSFTSVSASDSRRTSAGSADRMWNAMRWALLGPTPGSRPSSSIRSWTAPSYTPSAYGVVLSRRRTPPAPPRSLPRSPGRPRSAPDRPRTGAGRRTGATSRAPAPRSRARPAPPAPPTGRGGSGRDAGGRAAPTRRPVRLDHHVRPVTTRPAHAVGPPVPDA